METNFDVLVAGELNVDLIFDDLQQRPVTGKEVIANRMTLSLGSSAAIFASNLQTIGMRVSFIGKLGEDMFGQFMLSALSAAGVNTQWIEQNARWKTGASVALNEAEDRAMITFPGAMRELLATDIHDDQLARARHLHVSSAFLQPGLKPGLVDLFRRAKSAGLSTSFDPQWDPAEKWDLPWQELLAHIDIFLPNASELCAISKKNTLSEALDIFQQLPVTIVVKNGNEGAVLARGNERISKKAFVNPKVIDCIGAGDSFNAGFVHHFLLGKSLEDCLVFANLMGAVNTLAAGGTGAFLSPEHVRHLAHKHFNYTI